MEGYKRQRDAIEVPSLGNLSPFKELLEQFLDKVVRLDREASHGGGMVVGLAILVGIGMVTNLGVYLTHRVL